MTNEHYRERYKSYYAEHPEKKEAMIRRHWEREKWLMENDMEYRAKRIACRRASGRKYYQKNKERINRHHAEYERNNERYRENRCKYREEHKEHIRQVQKAYRDAHKEYYLQKNREFYARNKARKAQIQALQATIAELMGRLSTLERTRVQNERQRLQWGWDVQQDRIKLRRTRGEIERLSAKTRRRS